MSAALASENFGDREHRLRLTLLACVCMAHLAAILIVLHYRLPVGTPTSGNTLELFELSPLEAAPPPRPAKTNRTVGGGGSPGRLRERPPRSPKATTSEPPRWDTSPVPIAIQTHTLPVPAGVPLADSGQGGADGLGTGSGAGRGSGSGDGNGSGSGSGSGSGGGAGTEFARAEWIQRPPPVAYRRYWPRGHEKLGFTVTVKLACTILPNGRPRRCRPLADMPAPAMFGRAAAAIVAEGRVRPVAQDGTPRWDLPVIVLISFDPPDTPSLRSDS